MFASVSSAASTLYQWSGVLVLVLVGVFALVGIFDKVNQGKKEQEDKLSDRLIDLLKGQVEILQGKLAEQEKEIIELKKQQSLQARENTVLRDIIQGRDPETRAFQALVTDSMALVKQTHELVAKQAETTERMGVLLEAFVKTTTEQKSARRKS